MNVKEVGGHSLFSFAIDDDLMYREPGVTGVTGIRDAGHNMGEDGGTKLNVREFFQHKAG